MAINVVHLFSLIILFVQSSYSISLLDALRANHATQFADRLEADPEALALFTSDAVNLVFAPVDNYTQLSARLARRDVDADLAYQAASDNNDLSSLKHRKRDNSSASTLKPIETFLEQNTIGNQSVVPELADQPMSRKLKVRRNWTHTSGPQYPAGGPTSAPGAWTSTTINVTTYHPPAGQESSPTQWATSPTDTTCVSKTINPSYSTSTSAWYFPSASPRVRLASGLGDRVDIVKSNIVYDSGVIELTSNYFTIPASVSTSLEVRGLTAFENLIQKANLTGELDSLTGITVFAPSNDALAAYSIANDSSTSILQNLVKAHVVQNFVGFLPLLTNGLLLNTLAGTQLQVTVTNNAVLINGAKITFSNIVTENGVIQVIDKVLTPAPELSNGGLALKSGYESGHIVLSTIVMVVLLWIS